ncbi:hypothetical protein DM02DRAFT_626253 [Periconia macrospinosa]|uniref:Rhodopsin domain-containing protein n=1 Tax=Periconia macrospinosa TaxID=97972 RepID=A0A2V1DXG0_9PLEO|nr:hypothetical protein DM02DRAFT_626253 [Periconia macrospinosa]
MGSANSIPAVYDQPARIITIMFTVLTALSMAARIISRRLQKAKLGYDDISVYIAYFFNVALQIMCYLNVSEGAANLPSYAKLTTPDAIERRKWFHISLGIAYTVAMITLKISILLLYRHVFAVHSRWFSVGWWGNFLLIMPCYTVSTFTLLGLQTSGTRFGTTDLSRYGSIGIGSFNALSDLLVLILPIGMVWQLTLPKREKAAVVGIFMFGLLATAISIVRTVRFQTKREQKWNAAYGFYNDMMLTLAENSVGIMCACFLVIKPFLRASRDLVTAGTRNLISLASGTRSRHSRDGVLAVYEYDIRATPETPTRHDLV